MKEEIITRKDLIKKCDEFLNGIITKNEIEVYASNLIVKDFFEWNDELISDIIFEWDNEEINYPINHKNMELWKYRLETEINLLNDFNDWNSHIVKQKAICKKYGSEWKPINKKLIIGCSTNLNGNPLNGLRHPQEGNSTGWFIWSGEYSEAEDFFQPLCAEHLLQIRPEIIKYLGLEVGFRFLIDQNGYEDVWSDESLK